MRCRHVRRTRSDHVRDGVTDGRVATMNVAPLAPFAVTSRYSAARRNLFGKKGPTAMRNLACGVFWGDSIVGVCAFVRSLAVVARRPDGRPVCGGETSVDRATQNPSSNGCLQAAARCRPARVLRPARQASTSSTPGRGQPSSSPRSRNSRRSSPRPADTAGRRPHRRPADRRPQATGHDHGCRNTGKTGVRGPAEPPQPWTTTPNSTITTPDHQPRRRATSQALTARSGLARP